VDDIPYARTEENQASPTNRLTLHHIVESGLGILLPSIVPNNSDLREPEDTSQWPPALKAWAPKAFIQNARAMAKGTYYNDQDDDISDGIDPNPYIPLNQMLGNDVSTQKKHGLLIWKKYMDGVMVLWMRSARQGKGNQEIIPASDLAHRCDKVQAWVDSESRDW